MVFHSKAIGKVAITFVLLFLFLEFLMIELELREVVFHEMTSGGYRSIAIIVPIGISLLTALGGYWFAKRKNRSQKKWAILCFLLNIWGLIIVFFLPPSNQRD